MVVDLAGRAHPVQLRQLGGGAPPSEHLPQQPQPHGMPQRGEHLGGLGPVGVQQPLGQRSVLPGVQLPGRQPDGAGEQHTPGRGLQFRQLLLQTFQGPEVALLGPGGGPVGGLQGGEAPLEVGHTLFQLLHEYDIT